MTRDGIWQEFNRRMCATYVEEGDRAYEREQRITVAWFHEMREDERDERRSREQTAATILAALVVRGAPLEVDNLAETATTMADALRVELATAVTR